MAAMLLLTVLLTVLLVGGAEAAVWADEIETESDFGVVTHQKSQETSLSADMKDNLSNETRQLETIAFPVGIAIGAIGAAIWPSIFPESTTATSTTSGSSDGSSDTSGDDIIEDLEEDLDGIFVGGSFTTEKTTTTTVEPRTVFSNFPDCGMKGSSNRVVGGTEIVEGEYPWLCSLKYRGSHICGMTLLSGPPHQTILVGAAHCWSVGDDVSLYTITCGEHSLQKEDKNQVTLQVEKVIVHPRYVEASSSGFDIAVYKVTEAPLVGKMVRKSLWPVCLPDITKSYTGEKTWVAGWGITKTKNIRGSKIQVKGIPDIARHTDVTVVECEDPDNFSYPKGLICASEKGQDSCQGDSGGPLIAKSDVSSSRGETSYSWVGIVSFGVGCAEPGYPGAYTRSACYLGFVAEQFGLDAEFPFPGDHPGWSTDCQAGASRRSSAVRYKTKKNKKKRKKNKNRKKVSRDNIEEESSTEESSYVDRSDLITIDSYENVGKNPDETNKKRGKKDKKDKNLRAEEKIDDDGAEVTLFTILNKYLIKPLLSQ